MSAGHTPGPGDFIIVDLGGRSALPVFGVRTVERANEKGVRIEGDGRNGPLFFGWARVLGMVPSKSDGDTLIEGLRQRSLQFNADLHSLQAAAESDMRAAIAKATGAA